MRFLALVLTLFISTACQQQLDLKSSNGNLGIFISKNSISSRSIDSSLSQVLEDNGNLQFILKASSVPSDKDDFCKVGEIVLTNSYEVIIPETFSIRGLFKSELVIINFDNLFCSYTYIKINKNFVLDSSFLKSENGHQVSDADIEAIVPAKVVGEVVEENEAQVDVESDVMAAFDFGDVAVVGVGDADDAGDDVVANDVV